MSRSRSRSPDTRHHRSQSPNKSKDLPYSAKEISEDDYFLKSDEFRVWLKEEKDRYFDELSGEKARGYFRKFVKAWNKGKLPKHIYAGVDPASQSASSQTKYKWSFASKGSKADRDALENVRHAVSAATRNEEYEEPVIPSTSSRGPARSSGRVQGPTLPSRDDLVLAREQEAETRTAERENKRKRNRVEDKERVEDMVGPKESGREGMLEKKRVKREADKAHRDAKDDALGDYDDNTLMGGGDSFQARIAARDAAKRRAEERKSSQRGELAVRQDAMREKEKATMDMFKQMAKERFG